MSLHHSGSEFKSKKEVFSSYPGFIVSTDDYYVLESKLAVVETTLNILNERLYSKVLNIGFPQVTYVFFGMRMFSIYR